MSLLGKSLSLLESRAFLPSEESINRWNGKVWNKYSWDLKLSKNCQVEVWTKRMKERYSLFYVIFRNKTFPFVSFSQSASVLSSFSHPARLFFVNTLKENQCPSVFSKLVNFSGLFWKVLSDLKLRFHASTNKLPLLQLAKAEERTSFQLSLLNLIIIWV